MNGSNVGDVMRDSRTRALKTVAVVASIIVYSAMLMYTGVHNYTLMTAGVPSELLVWAVVGVITLEISALALPIALHWWTHSPLQRYTTLGFYLVDLALLWGNVVIDFARVSGGMAALPSWADLYFEFVVPATPLVAGLGWSLIWLLDPSQRERAMMETLAAATREALAVRIAEAARSDDVNETVDAAAQEMAADIVRAALGGYATNNHRLPSPPQSEIVTPPPPDESKRNGKVIDAAAPPKGNHRTG